MDTRRATLLEIGSLFDMRRLLMTLIAPRDGPRPLRCEAALPRRDLPLRHWCIIQLAGNFFSATPRYVDSFSHICASLQRRRMVVAPAAASCHHSVLLGNGGTLPRSLPPNMASVVSNVLLVVAHVRISSTLDRSLPRRPRAHKSHIVAIRPTWPSGIDYSGKSLPTSRHPNRGLHIPVMMRTE
jgi:hypothetical protein